MQCIDRLTKLGVATLPAALALAFGVAPAQAQTIGGLVIYPGKSLDIASIRVHTAGGCPQRADAYYARATGFGFPPAGQIVAPNSAAGMSHTSGFDVYFLQTMKDFA